MTTTFLAVLIFSTVFCLAAGALLLATDAPGRQRRHVHRRLTALKGMTMADTAGSLLHNAGSRLAFLRRARLPSLEKLQLLLIQADLHCRLEVFLSLACLSGIVLGGLGLLKWGPPGGLAGAVLGFWLPFKILTIMKRRRIGKFEKQLPDALELLGRGLKAGHAFTAGMQLVADEMGPPIGPEFFKTYKEHNHGLDLNTALLNLCRRIDLQDLRFFTTAVMIQRETGGNLAEILDKIAALVRERFKLCNQVKALTAEGRLSGIILTLLPPATAVALYFMNTNYIMLLWRSPKGRMMALIALVFQTLGILSIRKIVKIKV